MATNFDQIYNQFVNAQTPQTGSAPIDGGVPSNIPTQDQLYLGTAARLNGNKAVGTEQMRDIQTMDTWSLFQKYGRDAGNMLGAERRAANSYFQDRTAVRTGRETLRDNSISAIGGFANSILGIGNLAVGSISPKWGAAFSKKIDEANEFHQGEQSDALNLRRKAGAIADELDFNENEDKYQNEVKTDGAFVAALKRIGRDTYSATANQFDDKTLLGDTIASGIGSLFAGSPISGGLKAVGRGILKLGGREASVAFGAKAAMPLAIGAMEGGGAYQQTMSAALRELEGRDDLTEDQKIRMANSAAIRAAEIQAPIGALTGILTSKFESSPLKARGFSSLVQNALKETVEEAAQGGSAQLAQNQGIQSFVNPDQDISEGVGQQLALGAIGGLGAAGIVQAPGLAVHGAIRTALGTVKVARNAGTALLNGIQTTAGTKRTEANTASPVSEARMDHVMTTAEAEGPVLETSLRETLEASKASPTQKAEATKYVDTLFENMKFSDEDAKTSPIAEQLTGATNKFEALRRASALAIDPNETEANRLSAGLFILDTLRNNEALINSDLPNAIVELPSDEHPLYNELDAYQETVIQLTQHPRIQQALNDALKFEATVTPESVADVSTPEGQQAAKNAVKLAQLKPGTVNPEVNKAILFHAEQGNIQLTDQERGFLTASADLRNAENEREVRAKELEIDNLRAVSSQIRTDRTENAKDKHRSIDQHLVDIFAAVRARDIPQAKRRMEQFMNFAQSMQNKVSALNENYGLEDQNKKTSYKAWNPVARKWYDGENVHVRPNNDKTIKFAQTVALDAVAVGKAANGIARAFPQLGVATIQISPLDPAMQVPALQSALQYRSAKAKKVRSDQTKLDTDKDNRQLDLPLPEPESPPLKAQSFEAQAQKDRVEVRVQKDEQDLIADKASRRTLDPVNQDQAEASPDKEQSENRTDPSLVASEELADPSVSEDSKSASNLQEESSKIEVGLDTTYPNLLGSGEGKPSALAEAFKLPQEPTTRLINGTAVESNSPLNNIKEAFASDSAFQRFVGNNELGHKLTSSIIEGYSNYLGKASSISEALDKRLNAVSEKILGVIASNGEPHRFNELKAASIAEHVEGKVVYNTELRDNAVIAALNWLLTADQRKVNLTDEDVAKVLSIPVAQVTNTQIDQFNQGFYLNGAIRDLSNAITRYWGFSKTADAMMGSTKGIPEGVAKEIIYALRDTGLLEIVSIKENGKTYYQLEILVEKVLGEDQYKAVKTFPDAIEIASIVEPELSFFIGEKPKKVSNTQLRNSLVSLTDQQDKMLNREQEMEHRINVPMVDAVLDLDEETAIDLFGHGNLEKRVMNKLLKKSLESINLNVRMAYKTLESIRDQVENYSEVKGGDIGEIPMFYRYDFTSVNRLQMLGASNPQSNKLMREAVLPTQSTLDLTDSKQNDLFMLGVAQMLGVKVHKQVRASSINEVKSLLDGKLKPVIDLLRVKPRGWETSDVELLRRVLGNNGPVAPMALHAAMEYARSLDDKGDRTKFTTAAYVEADGITDGPINAMMNMVAGQFTKSWLEVMRKGGMFIGNQWGKTANESLDSVDLYQHTTNFLTGTTAELRESLHDLPEVKNEMDSLLRLMDRLLPDVSYDNESGDLTFKRGIVKNPLTVTMYGAGLDGISNKVSDILIKALYEFQSQALEFYAENPKAARADIAMHMFAEAVDQDHALQLLNEFAKDLDTLTSSSADTVGGSTSVIKTNNDKLLFFSEEFSIVDRTDKYGKKVSQRYSNLNRNIRNLFIEPMDQAIRASVGEAMPMLDSIRTATQVQGIYLQFAVQREIQKLVSQKDRPTDFISQAELDTIIKKFGLLTSSFISTGTQNIFVSGSETQNIRAGAAPDKSGRVRQGEFSRAFPDAEHSGGSLSTPAYANLPADPGVAGIPFTVISTGDGQMMQTFSVDAAEDSKHLLIFDGANFALDQLEENSRLINEAVYKGWMENPVSAISNSFAEFAKTIDLKNMNEEQMTLLRRALFGPKSKANASLIEKQIKFMSEELSTMSAEIDARKQVLAGVQMSIDHMASAESPYIAADNRIALDDMTDDEIINHLNQQLSAARKLKSAEKVEARLLTKQGTYKPEELIPLVRDSNFADKGLMLDTAKQLVKDGWNIIVGDETILENIPNGLLPDVSVNGFTHFDTRTVYLINPSNEVLSHEMIHAATFNKVMTHFTDPKAMAPAVNDAVARIEGLMNEWLKNDIGEELAPDIRAAHRNARNSILGVLGNTDNTQAVRKASAVNEFMAWVLTNQEIAQVAAKTEINPIYRIVRDAFRMIKELIQGKLPEVGKDLLSNLRFNTAVIVNSPSLLGVFQQNSPVLLHSIEQDQRLKGIRDSLGKKIIGYIQGQSDPASSVRAARMSSRAAITAYDVASSFEANGFAMSPDERATFETLVEAFATDITLNPNSVSRLQEVFSHVVTNLAVDDFMSDPEENNPTDRAQATRKFRAVVGRFAKIDDLNRSTLLSSFLAFSMVNEEFRSILEKIEMPKIKMIDGKTLDQHLANTGNWMLEHLHKFVAGEGRNAPNAKVALNRLADRISEIESNRLDKIEKMINPVTRLPDVANDYVVAAMNKYSDIAFDKLGDIKQKTNSKWVKRAADFGQMMTAIVNEKNAAALGRSWIHDANKAAGIGETWHELLTEVIGRSSENGKVYDQIKAVRSVVQGVRQQFREELPKQIAENFSRELTDTEWTTLFNHMGSNDLASLLSGYSASQIFELMTDSTKVSKETLAVEKRVEAFARVKAKELAKYLVRGVVPDNFLRNATAIANGYGEGAGISREIDTNMIRNIDHLTTLYALEMMSTADREILTSLVQTEGNGMSFVLHYLEGQRRAELEGAEGLAVINHYKGHLPSTHEGQSLIVMDDDEFLRLQELGYTRIADYEGSTGEVGRTSKGYYFAKTDTNAPFQQGIIQTVHQSFSGIDPETGFTTGKLTAGRIVDPEKIRRISLRLRRGQQGTEKLMPIYDENGRVKAYERSLDPMYAPDRNTNLAEMIGAWRGRQAEEYMAGIYNRQLVDNLHEMWRNKEIGEKDEFVNLFDPKLKDRVTLDAVRLIPRDTVEYAQQKFGDGVFMVRKEMLNNALGYRQASIGDAWTGNTRWGEETQKVIRDVLTAAFGIKAYKWTTTVEKLIHNITQDMRHLIVVKSIVVPITNLISNVYQMLANGVPLLTIARSTGTKVAEIEFYDRSKLRIQKIEGIMRASGNDQILMRKLEAERSTLVDAQKRLSIWPLIEAGEASSVSDVGVGREDLRPGKLNEWIENLADKTPDGIKTFAKYAVIHRDTALYKGLQKSVEYGDFLAKAILYDHLVSKGRSTEDALAVISEEFVNYDFLPGRTRSSLEKLGLTWFWNFKIRSTKIAMGMIRRNPVHALLAMGAPAAPIIGNPGNPLSDNFFSQLIDGKLGNSVGPWQGLRSYSLNPWVNLVS